MEMMQQANVDPRYTRTYPGYEYVRDIGIFEVLFYVFGSLALIAGLAGAASCVWIIVQFFEYHTNITIYDWAFFGMSIVVFIWKIFTIGTAIVLVIAGNKTELNNMALYFGVSFVAGIFIDILVIGFILLIIITGSKEINEIIQSILTVALVFLSIYFICYVVAMIALLKYINSMTMHYSAVNFNEVGAYNPTMIMTDIMKVNQ